MRKPALPLPILILLPLLLPGCLGAPVARQLASSAFTQGADHITGKIVENQEEKQRQQSRDLTFKDSVGDEYWAIFAVSQFQDAPPTPPAAEAATPAPPSATASRLVPVEIWGVVVGQEKTSVLERMRRNGSQIVPSQEEWDQWQLATGGLEGKSGTQLYLLLPPDFGRVRSGDRAIAEIAGVGGVHIARYRAEN
ncbi:MAG TPA: hypothetical protein PKW44_05105 [Methylophilaceae bacterium]|nr:hypothetical protein [Methylophilaceae bacterium]